MSVRFIWDNSYSVGYAVIDEQHEEMFLLGDKILNYSPGSNVKKDVMDLLRHAREHFSDEEDLMCNINYPKYEEHREQHDYIIEKLSGLRAFSSSSGLFMSDFKEILSDWIDKHIKSQDKVLINYYKNGKEPTHNGIYLW